MGKVCKILRDAKGLSKAEMKRLSDAFLRMLGKVGGVYGTSAQKIEKCRKCGADKIVKFGKDKNGKQRYKCKCCGTTFTETSYSAISRTRFSEDVWETYIHLLLAGASLEECAFQCGISVRTAFIWRHKILHTLQNDQDNRIMAGIVEADEKLMRVLSQEEQKKLISYLMRDQDICKLGILVALYTGLRIGELCALKWEDIEGDRIHVRRTMQRLQKENGDGTELHIGAPKTKTSIRTIPLPSFLIEKIEIFRRPELGQSYFLAGHPDDILEPRTLQYRFQNYLKEAGIDKANFHALRHTFATRCVEAGFEIKSLSEVLGHANVQTTLNKYVHSSFALKQANMDLLKLAL